MNDNATYRQLSADEIDILSKENHCEAEDWTRVLVKEGFDPSMLFQCSFSGDIRIGNLSGSFSLPGGVERPAGIRMASLHNVSVGDGCCIESIPNYIANYDIGDGCYIKNVSLMYTEGESTFGEGISVSVLNETGGREVYIHSKLSSHQAYMAALYRHRPKFQEKMKALADFYADKHASSRGSVGQHSHILNVGRIRNVRFGPYSRIEGAVCLDEGTVGSNADAPVFIGSNVSCHRFIISSGSKLDNGATIDSCFVGQACKLDHGYSANDSLFFSNSYGGNGEACAIFAGPYTVTHHKCSLLIAGMYSFMNAGSGSNQSNHMYKLGPIHNGIMERGTKTSSDSYVLYPAKIGPFSLVMGRHASHPDTSDLPFSYIIENEGSTMVTPGVNLRSVGTIRDAQKWPARDRRRDPHRLDWINFNLLSPFTIQKMIRGKAILKRLVEVSGPTCDIYTYNGVKIKNSSLKKGLNYYEMGIVKFLGNAIVKKMEGVQIHCDEDVRRALVPTSEIGLGDWVDVSGLIAPKSEILKLVDDVENGRLSRLEDINNALRSMYENYYDWEWTWDRALIESVFGVNPDTITVDDLAGITRKWMKAVLDLDDMLYADAHKEFTMTFMTGYGADGDERQAAMDFTQVRGDFATNPFVANIKEHISKKRALGEELLARCNAVLY